jgi:CRP/FNR family transcriptional regulator, anaerobic regulatory protein
MNSSIQISPIAQKHEPCAKCSAFNRCVGNSLSPRVATSMGDIRPHTRLLDKHDYIYRAGDSYTALYVVKAGCVKSFTTSESGEKQVLGFYLPGEIISFDGIAKKST